MDIWLQRIITQLEPNLIIALSGCTMRYGIRPRCAGDLNLPLGTQTPRNAGAKQIFAFINSICTKHGKDIVAHTLLAQVFNKYFLDAKLFGLGSFRFDFLVLTNISGEGHDLTLISILQPFQYDRSIQPP